MRSKQSIIRHAFLMVTRTIKSYGLLSVTITLTFSLLLGYLVFTDTKLYNQCKSIFAIDPNLATYNPHGLSEHDALMSKLVEKVEAMDNTRYYIEYSLQVPQYDDLYTMTDTGGKLKISYLDICSLPGNVFGIAAGDYLCPITWLPGQERETIRLTGNEAILSTEWFCALGLDEMEAPTYTVRLPYKNETGRNTYSFRIVGIVDNPYDDALTGITLLDDGTDNATTVYQPILYVNMEYLGPENTSSQLSWGRTCVLYTSEPRELITITDNLGIDVNFRNAVEAQDKALEIIRAQKQVKFIIAAAMLLLLGINLYSSFTNALSERRFEIGVKRAIGASSFDIVRQFLYESLLVMCANTLLSVALVADLAIIYKFIMEQTEWMDYIIYFSPYSIAMFAVCAVTLTVVFSLIFAYKSTQVQIVDYLKAE